MSELSDLEERIRSAIARVYRVGTFDPWKDAYSRSVRFEELFRTTLPDWPLRNQTDLSCSGATILAFLLHPGHYIGVPTRDGLEARISRLGGECFMALLEISHLGPFACLRFIRETFDRSTGELGYEEQDVPFREEDYGFLHSLQAVLEEEKIEIVPRSILEKPVEGVRLNVTEPEDVTIYHCLFDE